MKKLIVILAAACICAAAAVAQDATTVDLTKPATEIRFPQDFTLGSWYDSKWDATWTFESNDIKLYKGAELIQDFSGKVKDFTVTAGTKGLVVKFTCDAAKRTYQFTKPVSLGTDLQMVIDRHDTPASDPNTHYSTTVTKK
jgi:hypothetical protein